MTRNTSAAPGAVSLSTFEQLASKAVPKGAVMLGAVRPFESALLEKGRLKRPSPVPLWFLAETERNVFLWKNGLSLIHAPQFDFWIDLETLVGKRLKQLDRFSPDNPYGSSLWGSDIGDPSTVTAERQYLGEFLTVFTSVRIYADALCQAVDEALKHSKPLIKVALPYTK